MDSKQVMQLFEIIEKNTKIPEYEIENWNIWGILRTRIAFSLLGREFGKKKRIIYLIKRFPNLLRILKSYVAYGFIPYTKDYYDVLVRTTTDAKRDFINNKYKDVYFDDIITNSDLKYFVIEDLGVMEDLGRKKHFKPTLTRVGYFSEGLRLKAFLKKVYIDKNHLIKIKKDIINELKDLKRKKGLKDIDKLINFIENDFERQIIRFFKIKQVYRELCEKINPKIFMLFASYGLEAMVAGVKEAGVKVIELQHGIIYKDHFGYIYGKHLNKYKNKYPIPDYILTYGKYWNEVLLKNSFRNKNELISVGGCRIDFWKKLAKEMHKEDGVFENIFITSVGGNPKSLIKFVKEVLLILKQKNINVRITVKLHPGESKQGLKGWMKLKQEYNSLMIIHPQALNLYNHFLNSDFHASIFSSTHYEAISVGKPTAILKLDGWENISELIKWDIAKLVNNPEQFVKLIEHSIKKDDFYKNWVKNTRERTKQAQEEDAIDKNVKVVKRILK